MPLGNYSLMYFYHLPAVPHDYIWIATLHEGRQRRADGLLTHYLLFIYSRRLVDAFIVNLIFLRYAVYA